MSTAKTVLSILGGIFVVLIGSALGLALIAFVIIPFIGMVMNGIFGACTLPFTLMM